MSESCVDGSTLDSKRCTPLTQRITAALAISAAPTFAAMAIMTAITPGERMAMCSSEPLSLAGMAPMYCLMSLFHLKPWLELISPRRERERL